MTTVGSELAEWLETLAGQGIELWYEGDRLRFRAPKGALAPDQRARLSAQRTDVVAQLRRKAAATESTYPLSFSQQSLWFLHQQAPESAAYHVAMTARVLSEVDLSAVRQAVQSLVDRHAILRTRYGFVDGAPRQVVAGDAVASFSVCEMPGASEDALRDAVMADYRRPFDLEHGPVFRTSLFSRGPADHVLLITVHHIAADGWSLLILFEELRKLYAEATGGAAAGLTKPETTYVQYSAWQQEMLDGPEGERLWSYWREKLAPPRMRAELPSDAPRSATQTFRGASVPIELAASTTTRLKELARTEGATAFVVLLATFQALLYRLTGTEDVITGTPTFARSKAEFTRVVGDFVNSVPLRARIEPGMSFRRLVADLRRTVHEALDAQEFPLALLVQRLSPERDSARSPLFHTFFVLQRFDQFRELEGLLAGDGSEPPIESGGLRLASFPMSQQEGQFELALQMVERGGALLGALKYNTDLFDEQTIRQLAADYLALVEVIDRDPDVALDALPLPAIARGPKALLAELRARDIRLFLDGDRLRVSAPKGAMTEPLKARIAAGRDAIIVELQRAASATETRVTLQPIARDGPLPISSAQQRLWFIDRSDPGRAHYNVGVSARLRGAMDSGVLRRAIDILTARHESLRTRITESNGAPLVEILPCSDATLEVIDVSHHPATGREQEARRLSDERSRTSFDLATGSLARFLLVRLAPDDHMFTVVMHHAISDGWSMIIALREIWRAYDELLAGREPSFEPLPVQYVDYAAWEHARASSETPARQIAYWKSRLAGAPPLLELPTDRPRPAVQSFRGRRVRYHFDSRLLDGLKQLGRQHESTLFITMLAAWQLLLHRYSGQDDVVIGSPVANRDMVAIEGLIGCFVNNVVMRSRLGGNPTFAEYLAQVKEGALAAFDHGDLPFEVLVEALRPERSANHAAVFQVLFALQSFPTDFVRPAGVRLDLEDRDTAASRFDLSLEVTEYEGRVSALYEYSTDLFDDATIDRMHGQLERLLTATIADPSCPVRDLPLLSPEEQHTLIDRWNATTLEHDRSRCVHHLLEAAAAGTPDAPAIICGEATLTYRELDERANRLAQLLVRRGVSPRSLVAVCVDRTEDMPIAIAAVLKCGAAYVPLDPSHPADRVRYTLGDANVACAITVRRFTQLLGDAVPLVVLDESTDELAALPHTPPAIPVASSDLAYVIYTSGSTGRPKGVEIEHRNVVAFLEAMRREPGFTAQDVLLAVTTLSFDIAGLELWLPLTTGGRVVIATRTDVLDGERLAGLIDRHGVTVLQATPATWRLMIDAGWNGTRGLKALCGGEALPRDLAVALRERVGALWNMYGPTETTIWSTLTRVDDPHGPITIGRPIANTRVYVLEPSGRPAPIGVPGELCIGGEGVARGYRGRPELTAERFVDLALPGGNRERVYRTGDVARVLADGRLAFLGRRDQQVKLRGHRIELGEIESVLASHPDVKECVVTVREDTPGDQRLIAYVVRGDGATELDAEAARERLRERLPDYMVPNTFVVLPALPLTPNGKVDRRALPAPQQRTSAAVDDRADAAMTPVQRRVADLWRQILGISRVGLHDNFFDSGGHSLILVKLHAALKREFGCDIDLVELFQWTTVAAQAARVSAPPAPDGVLRRARALAARHA